MANKADTSGQIISLPKGGGAMHGIGEKFAPDLHTGTGNFTVPIALPPGRNSFQPQLALVYSTGNGNGPFGLGWGLSIPGVARQTSKGVPIHDDVRDTFILSGAEDLVPVRQEPGVTFYRPRTEGLFARIGYHRDAANSFWEVRSKDGLISRYGTPVAAGTDPAVIADPTKRTKVFAWRLTRTTDPFGNLIQYEYERDLGESQFHHWDQLYLSRIRYVDYTDGGATKFLVSVTFDYEDRPDAFSENRAGFEIRTRRRCRAINVGTHADKDRAVRTYNITYQTDPHNSLSLLSEVTVSGYDDDGHSVTELPPLTFGYTKFEPLRRDFFPITGQDMPPNSLADPDYELVDLFGNGLPDVLQMNGVVRYWRNVGGAFDLPRSMKDAPAGLALADAGVQLIDANGDGRTDLLVSGQELSGYYPLQFNGLWDRRSFVRYRAAPSFNLEDAEVKLVDLDGDGVTDAIRSGTRLECFFNDPRDGWRDTRWVERKAIELFPDVQFSDPLVRFADMTGDGLQDIAQLSDRNVEYWPSFGRGDWAKRISMRNSPHFPLGYDPKRILVGDVNGDGLADIVYVDDTKVTLWINQCGNSWSEPLVVLGTPPVTDADSVRLADMFGSGISGVLWSSNASGLSRHQMFFLDFAGGVKPYVLNDMDNHMGALTRVEYAPSTRFYLEDQKRPATRWKTSLPFPVQVVARVEVIDELSKGKLTTEYRYRHGYWDGAEREFRGFGMVEQRDTETFADYQSHRKGVSFASVDPIHFSPPTLTKSWFHQGPIGEEFGEWYEVDYRDEWWSDDSSMLERPLEVSTFLKSLPRRAKRDALRALRGSILRTELYALDGTERQNRPYTVSESAYGVCEVVQEDDGLELSFTPQPRDSPGAPDGGRPLRVFFPYMRAQRTTQWERGDDPMTQFTFTEDYDTYGQARRQTQIACPRGWKGPAHVPNKPFLATQSRTAYTQRDDDQIFIVDRVAKVTSYEIENDGGQTCNTLKLAADSGIALKLIGQSLNFYDGQAFTGLPNGEIGEYGALMRTETLVLDEDTLSKAYGSDLPPYFSPDGSPVWTADYPEAFRALLPVHDVADPTRPALTTTPVGYGFAEDQQGYAAGFFVASTRYRYDFQSAAQGRGLLKIVRDPLGRDTSIDYDVYELLPVRATDPVGLTTTAEYDYRVLQPSKVVDANDSWQSFGFTPMGLPGWAAVMDKQHQGDTEATPGVLFTYEFLAYQNSPADGRQPVFVRTTKRVHHVNAPDVPPNQIHDTMETVEYSDGFGRLLQTRTQAEDVIFGDPVFGGAVLSADQSLPVGDAIGQQIASADQSPSVIVSGWQIYDNKGQVVEKYEPFFSTGWSYAPPTEKQFGQKAMMFYDPRGQMIRTANPDGSEQCVIYGVPADLANPKDFAPTAWEAYTYDANDNAGRTHPSTSFSYKQHWNTPASIEVDALGRNVKAVARNGSDPIFDWFITRSSYDIRGNLLTVTDALSRLAFRYVYDLAKRALRIESIDAGVRRSVLDAAGKLVEGRDSKGALALHAYDLLNRPLYLWARDGSDQLLTLREGIQYGDGGDPQQPQSERQANRLLNRLGKIGSHYDEGGLLTFEAYDFKGNVLEKVRQVISDAAILAVFDSPSPNWLIQAFRVDWESQDAGALLDSTEYATSLSYDALNRIKTMRYPQDVVGARKELRPYYNRAGALSRVELDGVTYVDRIAYSAKGQRSLIAYGNGVMTRHAYDSRTFRLLRMRTELYTVSNSLAYHPSSAPLQDYTYEYDLAGNILSIAERTPGCGVINTSFGLDGLDRIFTYDALYRLISATGRECKDIPTPRQWPDDPRCGFNSANHGTPNQDNAPSLTALYQENYAYDPGGNMVSLKHSRNGASWTRHFGIGGLTPQLWNQEWPSHLSMGGEWLNSPGNRLTHVGDDEPGIPQTHLFDANGNLARETTSRHFEWDYADRMRVYRTQPEGSEPSIHAHYFYDSSGQRVKKLVRKQGGEFEVTVYIDGILEHHRIVQPSSTQENNNLHVMDNQSRIATGRVGAPFPNDDAPAVKFYLGDHLGSSAVVVANNGVWINREEFTPYGETSFGSFARKRYRFTGMERDHESGLCYHRARYYAPWVARWVSCDPVGVVAGTNGYAYARGNPVRLVDRSGTSDTEPEPPTPLENAAAMSSEELHSTAGPPPPPEEYETPLSESGATSSDATQAVPTLAVAARQAVVRGFAPVDPSGAPLKPPYNLWSGTPAQQQAAAAPGFVEEVTMRGQNARAMVEEWIAQGKYPPEALDNPRLLSAEDFEKSWARTSSDLARDAALSETPVENFGPNRPGSVKVTREIPGIQRWGGLAGAGEFGFGILNIVVSAHEHNPTAQGLLAVAGVTQATGGLIYGSGAILVNADLMAIGGGVAGVGSLAGGAVGAFAAARTSLEATRVEEQVLSDPCSGLPTWMRAVFAGFSMGAARGGGF